MASAIGILKQPKKKYRSVLKIIEAVCDKSNSFEQQVLALQIASKHSQLRRHCKSAGIVDEADAIINANIVSNLRKAIVTAKETDHM